MNDRLKHIFDSIRSDLVRVPGRYPVETGLTIYAFILAALLFEQVIPAACSGITVPVPIVWTLGYAANNLTRRKGRLWYYLSWLPLLPLSFLPHLDRWFESSQGLITVFVLCPLTVLACRMAPSNRSFVHDAISYAKALFLAAVFSCIAGLLFFSLYQSVVYVFGIDDYTFRKSVLFYTWMVCALPLAMWSFLALFDRFAASEAPASKFAAAIVNYLLTPAIVAYTVLLYFYAAKIAIAWELPRGGVAYIVFGFTLAAYVVKAWRECMQHRPMKRFFDRFSLIALPPVVLFWIGSLHRTTAYGLTDWRVYLIACGAVMTCCVLLFLSQRGRYLYVCICALTLFAAIAYLPGCSATQLSLRSQTRRAERLASETGLLDGSGRILPERLTAADAAKREKLLELYESLRYIERRDTSILPLRFGLPAAADLPRNAPFPVDGFVKREADEGFAQLCYLSAPEGRGSEIAGYRLLYRPERYAEQGAAYSYDEDSLRIALPGRGKIALSLDAILQAQLAGIGFQADTLPSETFLRQHADEMTRFRTDSLLLLFDCVNLTEKDGRMRFDLISVSDLLIR